MIFRKLVKDFSADHSRAILAVTMTTNSMPWRGHPARSMVCRGFSGVRESDGGVDVVAVVERRIVLPFGIGECDFNLFDFGDEVEREALEAEGRLC